MTKNLIGRRAAVSGALADIGINDRFMKELSATLIAGSSCLFVLVRNARPDKVLVHQVSDWCSGVAIKMGRRQGATKEHI